jgi:phosphatidate phosphatase APP1
VLLKNWGYGRDSERPEKSMPYKLARIRELLALFSGRRAVLIGDAGERDPEVYARIAAEQPARVAAVFIRLLGAEDQSSPRFRGQETFRDYAQALARARQLGLVAGQQATPTRPATPAASLPPAAPPVLARPAAPAPAATAGGRQ